MAHHGLKNPGLNQVKAQLNGIGLKNVHFDSFEAAKGFLLATEDEASKQLAKIQGVADDKTLLELMEELQAHIGQLRWLLHDNDMVEKRLHRASRKLVLWYNSINRQFNLMSTKLEKRIGELEARIQRCYVYRAFALLLWILIFAFLLSLVGAAKHESLKYLIEGIMALVVPTSLGVYADSLIKEKVQKKVEIQKDIATKMDRATSVVKSNMEYLLPFIQMNNN